jgi:uncharacterized protein
MSLSLEKHLDPVGPKRILALDGGGLRSVLTLGILREIEQRLQERHSGSPDFRLSDYFDLISGTSTGAIIAASLALGMRVDEVHANFVRLGQTVFVRSLLRQASNRAKYDAEKMQKALIGIFGERRLDSSDLRTGLQVLTMRFDTGTSWPITNHPLSRYFDRGTRATTVAVRDYLLWQVLRASSAAPMYFDPQRLQLGKQEDGLEPATGQFVDGGAGPYNNPAVQALMTATMPGYRFGWRTGEHQLLLVSVGAGSEGPATADHFESGTSPAMSAIQTLLAMRQECAELADTMLRWMSAGATPDRGDGAETAIGAALNDRGICSYLRYDVQMTAEWFASQLGESPEPEQLEELRAMDDPKNFPELDRVGRLAGQKLVQARHFPGEFDLN